MLNERLGNLVAEQKISADSFLCYVDDGSSDGSWNILNSLAGLGVEAIRLAGNCGHQAALMAALMAGMAVVADRVDCCITMGADLQDDPAVLPEFVEHYMAGSDVVLGVRADRRSDGILKRVTARTYYRVPRWLEIDIVPDHADYRLLSSLALKLLIRHGERNM